jgi:DNA-binding GntR family transcriptional regulator
MQDVFLGIMQKRGFPTQRAAKLRRTGLKKDMPIVARRRRGVTSAEAGKRRSRGSRAVYDDLREDILSLEIAPGSALDEVSLAERFGLSRTPIREALVMLSSERLVTFLPSRSAIVAPHTMENTPEYLDVLVLHARAVCRLAAQERTKAALEEIRLCQRLYEEAVSDPSDVSPIVAADLAFHNAIADAGRNHFLCSFYGLSLDYGRRMLLLHYYPRFGQIEAEGTKVEHDALVEAIAAADGERAEELATRHIHSLVKVIQRSLEPKLSPSPSLGFGFAREGRRS